MSALAIVSHAPQGPFSGRRLPTVCQALTERERIVTGHTEFSREHRDENPQPSITDAPQGAAVRVTSGAQLLVIGPRGSIMLNARPAPVVERLSQPRLARISHADEKHAFPAAPGDRRRPHVGAQRGIIPISQRAAGLGEHRGGDQLFQRLAGTGESRRRDARLAAPRQPLAARVSRAAGRSAVRS